jgi:hypothetical protein
MYSPRSGAISDRPLENGDRQIYYAEYNIAGALDVHSLPLRLIDGMPGEEYITKLYDKILDAKYYRATDRRVIATNTTVVKGQYQLFDVPKNSADDVSLDGSIAIAKKTKDYTNMIEKGKIEGGNTLIVDSLQVSVFIPHRDFNAFTANSGLPSSAAPSATDTNSATNTLLTLCLNTQLEFSEPDHGIYAEGGLWDFPADRVFNGCFGGATPEGFVQIGVGQPEYLRQVRILQELHHFDMTLEFFRDTLFPTAVIIDVALCGLKLVG